MTSEDVMFSSFRWKARVCGNHIHEYSFKDRINFFSAKDADWTWLSKWHLDMWNFSKFWIFGKIIKKYLPKLPFFNSKNGIYVKEHLSVNMCTRFQVDILKNSWVLPFWTPKKATFCTMYLRGFRQFFDFQILPDLGRLKSVLGLFLRFWRKSDLKTCIEPPKP